ncbi:MAG: glycosyltransferase family 39 protein [Calditrichota bacterium]
MPPPRNPPLTLWIVAGTALTIRLAYLIQYSHSPFFQVPLWDAEEYHRIASALAHGRLDPALAFRAPLYPLSLAVIYMLLGDAPLWPRLIQIGLGVTNVLLINHIAERIYGRTAGLIAGLIAAGAGMMFYFDLELLPTTLEVFLLLMALHIALKVDSVKKPGFYPGLWIGLAALARPTALIVFPVLITYLIYQQRRLKKVAVWSLFGVGIPLGLSLGLHLAAGAGPAIVSSQGGVNFYIGNQRQADGITAQLPGVGAGWSWETLSRIVGEKMGKNPSPREVDRYYWKEGFNEIRTDPAAWFRLLGHKSRLFWNHLEISSNRDLYYHARTNSIFRWGLILGFPLLLPLGLAGLFITWEKPQTRLLGGMIIALFAATVIFFVNARFRHPVLALMIILVGGGIVEAVKVRWEGRKPKLIAAFAGLALGAALLFSANSGVDTRRWDYGLFSEGQANERIGDLAAAERSYLAALTANPRAPYVNFHLAELRLKRGDWAKAVHYYRKELDIQPRFATAWTNFGAALIESGDSSAAIQAYQNALAEQPSLGEAQRNLQRLKTLKP